MQAIIPTRTQLLLPMLEELQAMGGRAKPDEVISALTDRFNIPEEVRNQRVTYTWPKWGVRTPCPWRQQLHWVRQEAATRELIGRGEHGIWTLTDKGETTL